MGNPPFPPIVDNRERRKCVRTQLRGARNQRGQAVVMVTVGLMFLMGLLGLVVDIGYGYYQKQVAQAAADSGAMAAAVAAKASGASCGGSVLCQTSYTCPSTPTTATNFDMGCLYAQQNGPSGETFTVSSGTGTVSGISTQYWVTVTGTQQFSTLFSRVTGHSAGTVSAQATGAVVGSGAGGCIYVLDPSGGGALNISGSAILNSNCGIYDDSSASNALIASGGSTVTASVVDVVGNVNISGGATITPSPVTGATSMPDPLASVPAPTIGGCDHTNTNISATTKTLSPGVYCGGIIVSGGANVTFTSGNYILNGGGFNISGNSTVTGSGVMFYNTSSGYAFGPVTISGGTVLTLSAPTSGTYQGILFFQDRSINSSAQSTFSGGTNNSLSGSLYFPTATLNFSGGATTAPITMAMICKDLNISGNAFLQKDLTGALTGIGKSAVYLIQ